MKMGTGGVGVGLGGQNMRIVFFFENKAAFDKFVNSGWQAQAAATAAAGNEGANAEGTFSDGMAYYVMTDAGLMLNADIAGTKYSKNDKLN
jgi:lipid-binding SYLF domain-containing protein